MHCSSSELLDKFVEGELAPPAQARVREHVASCADCAELLAELRVVDALLLTPRCLTPAPNFTFAVMAEVRSLPVPHVRRVPVTTLIASYLVFAWLAIAAFFAYCGLTTQGTLGAVGRVVAGQLHIVASVGTSAWHLFGQHAYGPTAAVAVLGVDLAAGAMLALVYGVVRPRLAAHMSHPLEVC